MKCLTVGTQLRHTFLRENIIRRPEFKGKPLARKLEVPVESRIGGVYRKKLKPGK